MPNNHMLNYKPGLTMDAPIPVTMAAADWIAFMTWASTVNTDGAHHLLYGVITPQLTDQLYTTESLKATEAHLHERASGGFVVRYPVEYPGVPQWEEGEQGNDNDE
jgi:hypothetical protein